MTHVNKRPKTTRKRMSPPGGDASAPLRPASSPSSSARPAPALHEPPRDPNVGTAPVHVVTDEMMDHAAHLAAEQADGVAHHTIEPATAHDRVDQAPVAPLVDTDAAVAPDAAGVDDPPMDGERPRDADPAKTAEPSMAAEPPMTEPPALPAPAVEPATEVEDHGEQIDSTASDPSPVESNPAETGSGASAVFDLYNAKVLAMMRANMAATGAHMAALFQTKSIPEAVALNADHMRRQIEIMTAQGRELTELAQTLTIEVLQPLKGLIPPNR